MLGNHFRAVSMRSCNQQNYAINCNFHQASSKHLITLMPKIYPFFSKSLSKNALANGLPGLLPMGQVRRQSHLPKGKLNLSQTTGWGLFRALPMLYWSIFKYYCGLFFVSILFTRSKADNGIFFYLRFTN